MRILIVEGDVLAARILAVAARRRGHKTFELDGWDAVDDALPFEPSACVIGMEDATEADVQPLTEFVGRLPRAVVSVVAATQIHGATSRRLIQSGVGDVIRKPYDPFELIERIERLGVGSSSDRDVEVASLADLTVDLAHYSAHKNGHELRLTKLELRLLFCLLVHTGRLASTERLLTFGWDNMEPPEPALLKTHISHLRAKLREAGGQSLDITSRHSLGYMISHEQSRVAEL